jgi:hypothetical protein
MSSFQPDYTYSNRTRQSIAINAVVALSTTFSLTSAEDQCVSGYQSVIGFDLINQGFALQSICKFAALSVTPGNIQVVLLPPSLAFLLSGLFGVGIHGTPPQPSIVS